MVQLKFHAVFVPELGKFKVSLYKSEHQPDQKLQMKSGMQKTRVASDTTKPEFQEIMTPARFLEFAREDQKPIVIDGCSITFEEDQDKVEELQVRAYFKEVAITYERYWNKRN